MVTHLTWSVHVGARTLIPGISGSPSSFGLGTSASDLNICWRLEQVVTIAETNPCDVLLLCIPAVQYTYHA